jgi:hypothetical protein
VVFFFRVPEVIHQRALCPEIPVDVRLVPQVVVHDAGSVHIGNRAVD